jgi:predicted NodU family carbamoyl transferase
VSVGASDAQRPLLGLSVYVPGCGAALVHGGRVLAAAEESWFSRRAEESGFPRRSAHACLRAAGLGAGELGGLVVAGKPLAKFERILLSHLAAFPRSARSFASAMHTWLGERLWIKGRVADEFGLPSPHVRFVPQALAAAAAAAAQCLAPDETEAAVLVLDDDGEGSTTALGQVSGGAVQLLAEVPWPHSLGAAAAALEQFLGRTPGAEPELLGELAVRGHERYRREFDGLIPARDDGSHELDRRIFRCGFDERRRLEPGFEALFGRARAPAEPLAAAGDPLGERDCDLAASFAGLVQRRVSALARELHRRVPSRCLLVAGALARDRRLLQALAEGGPFADVRAAPAADSRGLALGAAAQLSPQPARGRAQLRSAESELAATGPTSALPFEQLLAGRAVAFALGRLGVGSEVALERLLLALPGQKRRERLEARLGRDGVGEGARLLVPAEDWGRWCEGEAAPRAAALGRAAPRAAAALRARCPESVDVSGRVWLQAVEADRDRDLHRLLRRVGEATGAALLAAVDLRARGCAAPLTLEDVLEVCERAQVEGLFLDGEPRALADLRPG